jgi:hypothetical protein
VPSGQSGLVSRFYVLLMGVSPHLYHPSGLPLIYCQMNLVRLTSFRPSLGEVDVPFPVR